jgi:hypothetical protein
MIVFASTLRITRRPRRIPSVASLVRALGTVRISDQPSEASYPAPDAALPSHGPVGSLHSVRSRSEVSRSS